MTPPAASDVPERFDPSTMHGEILEAEHLARYRWAASLASGCRVLDAGCGTAYGSALLAESGALEVVGVDSASDVLDDARRQMPPGVVLEQGDVTELGYEDGRFDLVVCFEVIEHVADPSRALDEFRRVLSPDGVLALSSPNRDVYPPGNPHHVHEYTPAELAEALESRFDHVRLERQHTWITSGILDDDRFALSGDEDIGKDLRIRKVAADEPGAELYTVALAGQRELPEMGGVVELATAVELRKWDALWREQADVLERQAELLAAHDQAFVERGVLERQLRHEIGELRTRLAKSEMALARMPALEAQLKELLQVNDDALALNHDLQQRQLHYDELAAIAERYTVVVESTSWKLTRPLRRVLAAVRGLGR